MGGGGVHINDEVFVYNLQFVDDTIILGDWNNENMWSMKTILRVFKMVTDLKVNFYESKIYGVNLNEKNMSNMTNKSKIFHIFTLFPHA